MSEIYTIRPYCLPYAGMAEFYTHQTFEKELQKSIESLKESHELKDLPSLIDDEIQKYTNKFQQYQRENRLRSMKEKTNEIQGLLDQLRAYQDMPYEEVRGLLQTIKQKLNSGEPNMSAIQGIVPLIDKHFRRYKMNDNHQYIEHELYISAHFLMDCLIKHIEHYVKENKKACV